MLPTYVARLAVETGNDELIVDIGRRSLVFRICVRWFVGLALSGLRRENEQLIVPHNRRSTTFTGQRRDPFDIRLCIPTNWRLGFGAGSAVGRSPRQCGHCFAMAAGSAAQTGPTFSTQVRTASFCMDRIDDSNREGFRDIGRELSCTRGERKLSEGNNPH